MVIFSNNDKLDLVALIVSIMVIFLMTVIFLTLFILNNALRKKLIVKGVDDETFAKQLQKEFVPTKKNPKTRTFYQDSVKRATRGNKFFSLITNAVFAILVAILLTCFTFAAIFRANGDLLFVNDKAYLTVMTGSMSSINSANQNFLKQQGLTDERYRIETYSLITIEKVKSQDDLKVGDVVAYRDKSKNIIVHRIVAIKTTPSADKKRNTTLYFELRGDANDASTSFEKSLTFDQIIGRYNGSKSLGLGAVVVYIQSNIGLIALCFGVLIIFFVGLYEDRLINYQRNRMLVVARKLDNGEFIFSIPEKFMYIRRVQGFRNPSTNISHDKHLDYNRNVKGYRKHKKDDNNQDK